MERTGRRRFRPRNRRREHVILWITANPSQTQPLATDVECAGVQRELRMAAHGDDFRVETRGAVTVDDLIRALVELQPAVLHLSMHGDAKLGVMLQDERGEPQPVSLRALAMIVRAACVKVRVMVLVACDSAAEARTALAAADCVIAVAGKIDDAAARAFDVQFYGALANRRSLGNAVALGIAALAGKRMPDEAMLRCVTRAGIDANRLVLGAPRRGSARRSRRL